MDFIAIDFETAYRAKESALSIGLVKYLDGVKTDSYYSLIKPPENYILPEFTAIHGLTIDDVKDAPAFDKIWCDVKEFIGELPLVAHNAGFDINVLCGTLNYYKIPVPHLKYFDSLILSRKIWPDLVSHKLTSLGSHFGIEYDAHNALADADTCAKIIMLALNELFKANKLKFDFCTPVEKISVQKFLNAANCKYKKT